MPFLYKTGIVVILILLTTLDRLKVTCNESMNSSNSTSNMWLEAGRMTGLLLHNCMRLSSQQPQDQFLIMLQDCLKRRSLMIFDRTFKRDVIELGNGFKLVRYRQENDTSYNRALKLGNDASKFDEEESDWKTQVVQRIANVFDTHVLKIHFNSLGDLHFEGRRHHHRGGMMPLMVFGMVALGMIMIPMGFQFLAVLGGKALLLAKMALLLTSIQGLKKIATSNFNYGLYSTAGHGHHCKEGSLTHECDTLDNGDDIFVSFDVEDLSIPGHYDRHWPYGAEGPDAASPSSFNYYDEANQNPDLLHPLYPRSDTIRHKY